MEVPVTPEIEAEIANIATATGRPREELAAEALARGIELEARFIRAVQQGIADADAGRLIEDEEIAAWLDEQERSTGS